MFKKLIAIIMAVTIIGNLCGCGSPDEVLQGSKIGISQEPEKETAPTDTVIVIGNHANTASFNPSEADKAIRAACRTGGTVTIIVADGAPYAAAEIKIPKIDEGFSDRKIDDIVDQNTRQIMSLLSSEETKAKTPEFSDLQAITMAARQLRNSDNENKILVIMDTGLDTIAPLSFTNSLIDAIDIEEVVANLEESMDIPDLSGIQLVFTGLGDVGGKQNNLNNKERTILKDLWGAILAKSNAVSVDFIEVMPIGGENNFTDMPEVSCIEVMQPITAIPAYDSNTVVQLDDEILNFKPGSAQLITDENKVKEILKPIAEYLAANSDEKLLIVGTTASAGTESELKALSLKRCEKVRDILVSMNVNAAQLQVVGTGIHNPFYQNDVLSDGSLDSEIAKSNRSVIICGYDSQTAKSILNY